MSRYVPGRDPAPIFEAAKIWRDNALVAGDSIFVREPVWSDENLRSLRELFVDNPDEGEGTFIDKLERQLAA